MSIYKDLKAAGVPLDHHESDLYAKVTPESIEIVDKYAYKSSVRRFTSQIDKESWFDIPFAFDPYWEEKLGEEEYKSERDPEKTIVIFRKFRDNGAIIALFPEIPYDIYGWNCMSYMHVGQHGEASPHAVIERTDLATEEEYKSLYDELTDIGYNLEVRRKYTYKMHRTRQRVANEQRASATKTHVHLE